MKPIFIVGSPRTGTHWLRRVLGEHESIVSNPYESHAFPLILGPFLHARLPWNKSWRTVNRNYKNSHLPEWINRNNFLTLQKEYRSKKTTTHIKAALLAKSILEHYYEDHKKEKSRYLLEKSPNHIYYLDTINEVFDNPKIIEVQRHPVDVVKSLKTLSLKQEKWVPREISKMTDIWLNAVEAGRQFNRQYNGENMISIRYEDLVDDFDTTVKKAFTFLDIEFSDVKLSELKNSYKRTGSGGKADIYPLNNKEYNYVKNRTSVLCEILNYKLD